MGRHQVLGEESETTMNPSTKAVIRNPGQVHALLLSALMVALISVLSQIAIPLPLVPINLALLAVFLTGFILPQRWALIAVGAYLLMGALGLPVFSGLRGGPQALFGNTGGYLLGYFLSVAVIALMRHQASNFIQRVLLCLLALLACYVPGTLWLSFLTGRTIAQVLPLAVFPFILGDLIKCALAALLAGRLAGLVDR